MKQENQYLLAAGLILAFWYTFFWGPEWKEMYIPGYRKDEWVEDYERKEKVLGEERSAEQKALGETQAMWNRGPSFERQHPHVEGAHMTRWQDEIAEESGQPRFVGIANYPFPDDVNQMGAGEKREMIEKELERLRNLQRQVKDNLDLWVKNGSDPHQQIMSPQSGWWANPLQVERENHEILLEIGRLENMDNHLWELLNRRVSYSSSSTSDGTGTFSAYERYQDPRNLGFYKDFTKERK